MEGTLSVSQLLDVNQGPTLEEYLSTNSSSSWYVNTFLHVCLLSGRTGLPSQRDSGGQTQNPCDLWISGHVQQVDFRVCLWVKCSKCFKKVERNNRHCWQLRQDCHVTIELNHVEVADLDKDCFSGTVKQKHGGFKGGWEERKWLQSIKNF